MSACAASPDDTGAATGPVGGGTSEPENDLVVEYDPGDGSPLESWVVTCVGSVDGTHPHAEAACAHLAGLDDPFAPLPEGVACTEIYGGPQSAHVAGHWGGDPVDIELSRVDGCRIAQWDALGPLLPSPVGVEPPG
jgi:hypothetical protein